MIGLFEDADLESIKDRMVTVVADHVDRSLRKRGITIDPDSKAPQKALEKYNEFEDEAQDGGEGSTSLIGNEYLLGLTKPSIRRLARRGGVKRISADVYSISRTAFDIELKSMASAAIGYAVIARRSTVTAMDVVCGMKARAVDGLK